MVEGVNQFAHALKFPPGGDDVTTATYFLASIARYAQRTTDSG
jgi:hypothetical protein